MSDIPDDVMEMWLSQCSCCPECNQTPCGGVVQGGLCDGMPCRCEDEDYLDADDYDDEDPDCTLCAGAGIQENDDPLWHGWVPDIPCEACDGTGLRKHQTVF